MTRPSEVSGWLGDHALSGPLICRGKFRLEPRLIR
jgi:hypothetical protein